VDGGRDKRKKGQGEEERGKDEIKRREEEED